MEADLAAFGMTAQSLGIERAASVFEVFPENWESVLAFLALETQWRTAGTANRLYQTGLDYVAADVVLRRLKSPDHVFDDLRVMERTALAVFREAG